MYPAVREGVSFHVYPDHRVSINSEKHGTRALTWDAWQVYQLADGTRTVDEMVGSLSRTWQIGHPDELLLFCAEAEAEGYLDLGPTARPRSIEVVGSDELWFPERALIELTNRCNLRCQYCYASCGPQNSHDLRTDNLEWLFSLMRTGGVRAVELSGGEPTIHPDFQEILESALRTFDLVGLLTNGAHLAPEVFQLMEAYKHKLFVQVSVDGSNEQVNAAVRGTKGTFGGTLQTITELVNRSIPIRVGFVVTPDNQADLSATCELMREVGVRHLVITMPDGIGRGAGFTQGVYSRTNPCWGEAVDLMTQAFTQHSDIIINPAMEHMREDIKRIDGCHAGCTNYVIDPNGDVKPCPLLPASAGTLGNVSRDDYASIFNDTPLARCCQSFSVPTPEPACQGCKYEVYCGKCMARVFLANKNRLAEGEGLCPIARRSGLAEGYNFDADVLFKIDLSPVESPREGEQDGVG
jgi:radical SAM protein with 4Fe4S-binding SPASM domain